MWSRSTDSYLVFCLVPVSNLAFCTRSVGNFRDEEET